MNIVTFETAKRLKEAGFPQPEPALGQFWYNRSGTPYIISRWIDPESSLIAKSLHGGAGSSMHEMKRNGGFIFAPTATDILRELNRGAVFHSMVGYSQTHGNWRCTRFYVLQAVPMESVFDENPAEACALAWLQLHEK